MKNIQNSYSIKILFLFLITFTYLNAKINLIKKENPDSNTTLLVIAGIHGNEPGGYFAASILATHYNIKSKNLWIVPNLNKKSIQSNSRGVNGDMNRKFSEIKKNDKDLPIIKEIKDVILSKNVSLVLNLHDGNGFYRKEHQGSIFNPNAWGQTCVIDQHDLDQNQTFGNLSCIAATVKDNINKKLLQEHHIFDVKNTNTKFHDEAMKHSLTYFSVTNNKPAFALESSKDLPSLSKKVFYQLVAIEEFMNVMEISFTRNFKLNTDDIEKIVNNHGTLMINNNIMLNFRDIKKYLSYIPIKSKNNVFEFSNPLGSVKKVGNEFVIYIGNKRVTTLRPQYFDLVKKCPEKFSVNIDGKLNSLDVTSHFSVNNDFAIVDNKEYRVNVIGFKSKKHKNESGVDINLNSLKKRFSVDSESKTYRVEFYKDDEFCFMSMAHFK